MKKIDVEKMSTLKGGKFFGTVKKCQADKDCFQGTKICQEKFYFFWIPFEKDPYPEPCTN